MQSDSLENPLYIAKLESFLDSGGTFAMLQDISGDTLEQLYAIAFGQFQAGKWEDSHMIFQVLCTLDHYEAKYFLGLGACRQSMGQLEMAVQSYSYGSILDLNDPRFPFHAAECRLQEGDLDGAESGFYSALLLAEHLPEQAEIAKKAKAMLEAIVIRKEELNEPTQ